jgi:hypothetical protein
MQGTAAAARRNGVAQVSPKRHRSRSVAAVLPADDRAPRPTAVRQVMTGARHRGTAVDAVEI